MTEVDVRFVSHMAEWLEQYRHGNLELSVLYRDLMALLELMEAADQVWAEAIEVHAFVLGDLPLSAEVGMRSKLTSSDKESIALAVDELDRLVYEQLEAAS